MHGMKYIELNRCLVAMHTKFFGPIASDVSGVIASHFEIIVMYLENVSEVQYHGTEPLGMKNRNKILKTMPQ